MKKTIVLLIATVLAFFSAEAQETNDSLYVFSCEQSETDFQKCIAIKNRFKSDLKRWATHMTNVFPLDVNNAIHVDYIITCNKELPIDEIVETSIQWFNYAFSSANAVRNAEDNCITANGFLNKIAEDNVNAIYYIKYSSVSVTVDIKIRFKENRIRFEGYIRHYQILLADSAMRSQNNLIAIESTYPFEKKSPNKDLYSMAFINSTSTLIDKANNYVDFLNKNFATGNENDDDDW